MSIYVGVPYSQGSTTSFKAALAALANADKDTVAVAFAIYSRGDEGATDEEVEMLLGRKHQTVSARRNELAKTPLIEAAGERKTRSGVDATVWRWTVVGFDEETVLGEVRTVRRLGNDIRKARPTKEQMREAIRNVSQLYRMDPNNVTEGLKQVVRWMDLLIKKP